MIFFRIPEIHVTASCPKEALDAVMALYPGLWEVISTEQENVYRVVEKRERWTKTN